MPIGVLWAVLGGAIFGALADWLFAGLLFHGRYQRHPDTWRPGLNDRLRLVVGQLLTLMTAAAFAMLASRLGQVDLSGGLKLAAMIWLIAPLPMLLTNVLFIRIDPLVVASQALGWLVKLLLCGAAVAIFL